MSPWQRNARAGRRMPSIVGSCMRGTGRIPLTELSRRRCRRLRRLISVAVTAANACRRTAVARSVSAVRFLFHRAHLPLAAVKFCARLSMRPHACRNVSRDTEMNEIPLFRVQTALSFGSDSLRISRCGFAASRICIFSSRALLNIEKRQKIVTITVMVAHNSESNKSAAFWLCCKSNKRYTRLSPFQVLI